MHFHFIILAPVTQLSETEFTSDSRNEHDSICIYILVVSFCMAHSVVTVISVNNWTMR